ncbi:ABC transporter substrate-binding protein [Polynucleobacter sp. MWH-Spelu-300-X4]|uniref:ABC transporter substrate-binding protein n=1 Tax=Polynucleobacter sp. MWH-Spelu-300-X4 TaxID=2689109 RepID=UPI001BFD3169|nr:ABC transporter substrate-binding protein [Polynucleobacter sp. MWH-Spelu-300-X4]QWD80340.1 ABC transporter substrate-binding protein [Polynucleobacter sp. MWH-Spelu-300-X4]
MKKIFKYLMPLALAFSTASYGQNVKIFGLVELSGPGVTSGSNFDNGAKLAIKEINAAGGILGKKIDYISLDTQSNPGVAKGLALQAVDSGAYVVMGPVFSGSVMVSMSVTRQAEIPNFTGGEAAGITQQGNPYIFRTSFTQASAMPKIARYIKEKVKAKTVDIIFVNNDFGKGGRDLIIKSLQDNGVKIGADVSTESGQIDFSSAVIKVKQSSADAVFVYTNEEEAARVLRELKKQGYNKPVIGETVLTSQKVIELAGEFADGAIAHVGLTADAPQATVKKFDAAYQKEYKTRTDHNGLKGYTGIYIIKAVTEKIGKFDSKAFAAAMKNVSLSAKTNPGILLDVSFDANGDLDRESYMTKVVGKKQVVTDILPPVNKK